MIADAKRMRAQALHDKFVEMLPSIHQQARVSFRGKPEELLRPDRGSLMTAQGRGDASLASMAVALGNGFD